MNERILKFSIRSYNEKLIETCKSELNQMVENLNKLIKSEQLFDESFNRSNQVLIHEVESLFPKSKVSYRWDFTNHTISVVIFELILFIDNLFLFKYIDSS